ncbi:regulatory LuxR family protein [Vibrio sp. ES.051]|uniref:helix-turn-helix transcriptional regulator n=1 Tax=Vibrio sp. ES.051 TaxID=1761909 RepID=UPI000BF6503C|nr:response regulator transcription factor [Vibrio sp. ES.051]PFG58197.1 regulatory LuxR family protein [Vibrio sp. ES.051]
MHSGEYKNNKKNKFKHILLIGDNCINNQFIQREIEKNSYFSLSRTCILDIERSSKPRSSDVVLISYLVLSVIKDINVTLSKVTSNKWVIYDFPKDIVGKSIAEMQFINFMNLKGIIYQDAPIEHLTRCLKTVCDDDLWLPRKLMSQMLSNLHPYAIHSQEILSNLTKREIQIFKRIIEGNSNLEISEDLFIAESTVKTHIYNIYKKLNVTNRKEAIQKAMCIKNLYFSSKSDLKT